MLRSSVWRIHGEFAPVVVVAALATVGCGATAVQGSASARAYPGPVLLGPVSLVDGSKVPVDAGKHDLDESYGLGLGRAERTSTSSSTSGLDARNADVTFARDVAVVVALAKLGEPYRCTDLVVVPTFRVERSQFTIGTTYEDTRLSIHLTGYVAHALRPAEAVPAAPDTADGACRR
jgi:hypothetical protein